MGVCASLRTCARACLSLCADVNVYVVARMGMCVYVRAYVRVCMCARACVRVRECVRAVVRECVD